MFVSSVIEIWIGLAVVYYVAGLIVSFITSQISTIFEMRGRDLYKVLDKALDNKLGEILNKSVVSRLDLSRVPPLTQLVRNVKNVLKKDTKSVFENLPSSALAAALLDGVNINSGTGVEAVNQIMNAGFAGIEKQSTQIDQNIIQLKQNAQKNIETWLDNVMLSVSALYKGNVRKLVIAASLAVTVALNVDTIEISTYFWKEPIARQLASIEADKILETAKDASGNIVVPENYQDNIKVLQDLQIPILWENKNPFDYLAEKKTGGKLPIKIAGWLITWAAISQGSSFWYDMLKKFKSYSAKLESGEAKP